MIHLDLFAPPPRRVDVQTAETESWCNEQINDYLLFVATNTSTGINSLNVRCRHRHEQNELKLQELVVAEHPHLTVGLHVLDLVLKVNMSGHKDVLEVKVPQHQVRCSQ